MESEYENSACIVNGPSKWDLVTALFDGKQVEFTIKFNDGITKAIIKVQVNSVEAEDGSRDSWNLKGGIVGLGQWSEGKSQTTETISWRNFKAYFSSKYRKGSIFYS